MGIMFKQGELQVRKGESTGFPGTRVAKKGARKPGVSKIGPRGRVRIKPGGTPWHAAKQENDIIGLSFQKGHLEGGALGSGI